MHSRLAGRPARPTAFLGIAVLAAATLAACSGAPAISTAPSAAASPSAATSPETSASPSTEASPSAASPAELQVEGKDFAFVLPAEVPAGVTKVTLDNTGQEEHQAQIAKINEGKTFADLTAALQQPDPAALLALITLSGGPTGVAPGASGSTTMNLEPGAYAFLCFVTSPDGIPHLAKGMVAPVEVTGTASGGTLPPGDAQLDLQDFAFVGLSTLTPGAHTITVSNKGPQPHEATLVKLADGVTGQALAQQFASGEPSSGPPPWTPAGGITGITVGTSATMDIDVTAGEYALICFIPDPATGKAHAELGMVGALTVQ